MEGVRPEFEAAFRKHAAMVDRLNFKRVSVWFRLRDEDWIPESLDEALLLSEYCGYQPGWAYHLFLQASGSEQRAPHWWGDKAKAGKKKSARKKQTPPPNRRSTPSIPPEARLLGLAIWPVSADELKRAYRCRAKQTHPDLGGDPAEFRTVAAAYEKLRARVA